MQYFEHLHFQPRGTVSVGLKLRCLLQICSPVAIHCVVTLLNFVKRFLLLVCQKMATLLVLFGS